jgi:glycosyltransferase involved in cell wall biosynthesis
VCSRSLMPAAADPRAWTVVYNAVPDQRYEFQHTVASDAPLVILGRVESIKGTHLAIDVAKRSGRRLIIAGNVPSDPVNKQYFARHIVPHLGADEIMYVGPIDDSQKNELLGQAAALLMPVLWEEPFGIVMAEALACGTPVVGLRRGAIPEVVEDRLTGFVCDDLESMVSAVHRLSLIDRQACRSRALDRFSGSVMAESYLRVYRELLTGPLG